MKDFRNLQVWEKSHRLALEVYEATRSFPREVLEYSLLLARELSLLDEPNSKRLEFAITEVKKMLAALIRKLNTDR